MNGDFTGHWNTGSNNGGGDYSQVCVEGPPASTKCYVKDSPIPYNRIGAGWCIDSTQDLGKKGTPTNYKLTSEIVDSGLNAIDYIKILCN